MKTPHDKVPFLLTACAATMISGSNPQDVQIATSSMQKNALKALKGVSGVWRAEGSDKNPFLILQILSQNSSVTIRGVTFQTNAAVQNTQLFIDENDLFDKSAVAVSTSRNFDFSHSFCHITPTVLTSNSCTSRPVVCQCLIVQTIKDNMSKYKPSTSMTHVAIAIRIQFVASLACVTLSEIGA